MSIEVYENDSDYEYEYIDDAKEQRRKQAVEEIVELRAKGRNFKQIENETGIPAAQAAVLVNDYLHENFNLSNAQQMRMLQVQRLERITTALWGQVIEGGDLLTQGKQTSNLLATLNQLTTLLDLNKSSLVDAQVELTKAQTQMTRDLLTEVRGDMLEFVEDILAKLPRNLDIVSRARREISDGWAGAFHAASEKAVAANRVRRSRRAGQSGAA